MFRIFDKIVVLSLLFINLTSQDLVEVAIKNNTVPSTSLEISAGKCSEMEKNVTLKLSSTESKKLIDGFMDSSSINCLSLEENQITGISPEAFRFLPNLYYLNLARNSIPILNLLSFKSHPKLRTLVLDENFSNKKDQERTLTIESIFPNLRYLYLRQIGIDCLSDELDKKLPNLTHLYLSDNFIKKMEFFPSTLTHLYLERNQIEKFNVTMIKRIKVLKLDGNRIKTTCNTYCHEFFLSLSAASNLRNLSLSGNELNDVEPDSFDDTINLLNLDLSENKIRLFRKGTFTCLSKLENLTVSRNLLKILPDFSPLVSLQGLNLSENKIETISAGVFRNLVFLRTLSLSGNLLAKVEVESFGNLLSLVNLDLSKNRLQSLPGNWLTGAENLRILDLRGNCFSDFSKLSLDYMDSLGVIFLQNNPMRYVNTRLMSNFPKNVSIYLENEYKVECVSGSKSRELRAGNSEVIKKDILSNEIPSGDKIN